MRGGDGSAPGGNPQMTHTDCSILLSRQSREKEWGRGGAAFISDEI
jgi:hypothetical protein